MANDRPRIAAIVLAAGKSTRMGSNKLLADLHGAPLIRRTVEAVVSWPVDITIVVTGHESDKIAEALQGLNITSVHNVDYALGLAASLRRGLDLFPENVDGALVCLGDMPLVQADTVSRLIAAFTSHQTICVPVYKGTRGNPMLWGKAHFPAMIKLSGDRGAKSLMDQLAENVIEIETPDEGTTLDADTPETLNRVRSLFSPLPAARGEED